MGIYGQDPVWDAVAITGTDPVPGLAAITAVTANPTGAHYDPVYAPYKTLAVVSTLNEAVSIQLTWSLDGQTYYPFGDPVTVAASTGSPVTALISASTPTQYVPYVSAIATCSTAPTSGTLTGTVARLG